MGPYTIVLASSSSTDSGDLPYTSEVDGKISRFRYFTHWRTIDRFASKSSSNTRSGSVTYCAGFAIATSGTTTSHLLMWYSIHSRLIVMAPTRKSNDGFEAASVSL